MGNDRLTERSRARAFRLILLWLSLLMPFGATAQSGELPDRIDLYAGQTRVYKLDRPLTRVAVGKGELIEVRTIRQSELLVIANQPGDTSLHLWMRDGTQKEIKVRIADGDADGLARELRAMLSNVPDLQVIPIGANVILAGSQISAVDSARIKAIQEIYPQVLDFTTVDPVGLRPMVLLDVQIMEFKRDALEEIGIRWDSVIDGPFGGLLRDFTTNPYYRVLPENSSFDRLDNLPVRVDGSQGYFGIATTIGSKINLLMNQGKAFVLASPQLSTRSGGKANFLVGGEVPIPISSLFGQTQVEFKEYGIKLDIEPVVNENGEILTGLLAEISRVDPSVSVEGIPGFITRRTQSEINVRDGQTIVVSGLINSEAAKAADKFPFLGDIPILGRLFRSDEFRSNRTDLVIFVTPRVISPDSKETKSAIERGERIREEFRETVGRKGKHLVE